MNHLFNPSLYLLPLPYSICQSHMHSSFHLVCFHLPTVSPLFGSNFHPPFLSDSIICICLHQSPHHLLLCLSLPSPTCIHQSTFSNLNWPASAVPCYFILPVASHWPLPHYTGYIPSVLAVQMTGPNLKCELSISLQRCCPTGWVPPADWLLNSMWFNCKIKKDLHLYNIFNFPFMISQSP